MLTKVKKKENIKIQKEKIVDAILGETQFSQGAINHNFSLNPYQLFNTKEHVHK